MTLKEKRILLDLTAEQLASGLNMSESDYLAFESANLKLPRKNQLAIDFLAELAAKRLDKKIPWIDILQAQEKEMQERLNRASD